MTAPVYFPDSFHLFTPDAGDPVILALLVPITPAEADFVEREGGQRFEDELERQGPDLLELERPSITLR